MRMSGATVRAGCLFASNVVLGVLKRGVAPEEVMCCVFPFDLLVKPLLPGVQLYFDEPSCGG